MKKKKKKHPPSDWLMPFFFILTGAAFFGPGLYMTIQEAKFRVHAILYPGFLVNADPFHTARSHYHPPVLVRYMKPNGDEETTFVTQHFNNQYHSDDSLPILINESLHRAEIGGRSAWLIPGILMFMGVAFFALVGMAIYLIFFL
jgi:hypothetical protein